MRLVDRDQTTVRYSRHGRSEQAATVFFSVHPLLAGGTAFTYKAGREYC